MVKILKIQMYYLREIVRFKQENMIVRIISSFALFYLV